MNHNHTKGPWVVEDGMDILGGHGESCHIATLNLNGESTTNPVNEANARLIASAPDLLAALTQFAEVEGPLSVQDGIACLEDGTLIDLRHILAKATGDHQATNHEEG